jgi:protein phosphatase
MYEDIIQLNIKSPEEIKQLTQKVIEILKEEKKRGGGKLKNKIPEIKEKEIFTDFNIIFLKGDRKAIFVGDLHGDFKALCSILEKAKEDEYLIFLGDYVDRGENQIEVINTVLKLKKEYPEKVFLLKGNHESREINEIYGFIQVLQQEFPDDYQDIYQKYMDFYEVLPSVLITKNKIIATHGGIPHKPASGLLDLNSDSEKLYQIRWNDPSPSISGFAPNIRGEGTKIFGQDVFEDFIKATGANVMITSHRYIKEGYQLLFEDKFITIFSSWYFGYVKIPRFLSIDLNKPIIKIKPDIIKIITNN